MNLLSKVLCLLGVHGPNWFGAESQGHRSFRSAGFERTCSVCGAVWHGRQVYGKYTRYAGDWRKVK